MQDSVLSTIPFLLSRGTDDSLSGSCLKSQALGFSSFKTLFFKKTVFTTHLSLCPFYM